ncbi:hypothetical protein ACW5R3_12065 [Bizionia sp. KMM 8389]
MKEIKDRIKNVESEMLDCRKKLDRMKKRIPLGIILGLGFSLLFPYLPGKRGRSPMIETWEYQNAVLFSAAFYAITYPIGYSIGKNKLEKKLRELKLKKHLIEKEIST